MGSLPNAIAQFEGYNLPNSLASVNNNPGNLVYSPTSQIESEYGATEGEGGFAAFPDPASGFSALQARLSELVSQGDSVSDIIHTWAGSQYKGNSQASEDNYTNFVAQQTGLNPNTPILSQLTPNNSIVPDSTVPFFGALNLLGAFGLAPKGVGTNGANTGVSHSFIERIVTGIIGLICIAGSIYLFKPTQSVIVSAASKAKDVATTALAASA